MESKDIARRFSAPFLRDPRYLVVSLLFVLLTFAFASRAQEINPAMSVQEHFVGTNTRQRYFLIERNDSSQTNTARGLILILPGGPGGADFLPFCANVLTLYGIPTNFVVAELVAPQWSTNENHVVWPSRMFSDPQAKFTSEEFLKAVITDVCHLRQIDERYVFTLGWSSSGHVLYSAAASEPAVRGSIIAMSRFLPSQFPDLEAMRGKNIFLYHSPDDQICPFSEAQLAEKTLTAHGARVKLETYNGGHGWVPNTFYCDRIREGIGWLKHNVNETNGAENRTQADPSDHATMRLIIVITGYVLAAYFFAAIGIPSMRFRWGYARSWKLRPQSGKTKARYREPKMGVLSCLGAGIFTAALATVFLGLKEDTVVKTTILLAVVGFVFGIIGQAIDTRGGSAWKGY